MTTSTSLLIFSFFIASSNAAGVNGLPVPVPLVARAAANCYPTTPNSTGGTLSTVIKMGTTANGFTGPARGWNSWGVQGSPKTTPSYPSSLAPYVNQTFVIEQCSVLAGDAYIAAGYDLCSIDGKWYSSVTDDYGRVTYNTSLFDMPTLGTYLHDLGLKLGVYSLPGIPCEAANKTIYGTSTLVREAFSGVEGTDGTCFFNHSSPYTQVYYNTLVALWASWGVDMVKLDYLTPGSSIGSLGYPTNSSLSASAFHTAIANSGRAIRLDLSSNLRQVGFVGMWLVQNTIEQYQQYINQLVYAGSASFSLHPDMDDLFIANPASVTGVTDGQRITLMSHWIGAGANLILGSDMTNVDDLGLQLITSDASVAAANFCGTYPMQPRNPGTGSNQPIQLQAWVSGPSDDGEAYVLLTNLGTNLGKGGYVTVGSGNLTVSATLDDLGLTGAIYNVTDVWTGGKSQVSVGGGFSSVLDDGESTFLHLVLA
ncbi:hypothetical protein SEUCBS140593_009504 [Sporothrix eucalyptigena]|uniref:alpha-galactosidase n=1 Tax=Sporothrix eucalyptigena TaxID=1812306 RepID=A0ABP0CWE3_9PEZI